MTQFQNIPFSTLIDVTNHYSIANTSNPPTAAELTSAFGTPATAGAGFWRLLNDNGAGTNEYLVISDGTNWIYFTGTKAV